jgi:hypothetical protein
VRIYGSTLCHQSLNQRRLGGPVSAASSSSAKEVLEMGRNKRLTVIIHFDGGNARKQESLLWTSVRWIKRLLALTTIVATLAKMALG